MSRTFASLDIANYRRYFIGTAASNLGIWMTRTAQAWLVLIELTDGDAQALGWLTSAMFLPTLLLMPLAGRVADRFPKRSIMLGAQGLLFVNIVLLATLTLSGHVQLWHVFGLAFLDGVAGAFDGPARQSIVPELVGTASVSNAIGLNSTSFNAARLLGPGIAGGLIFLFGGTGPVFILNAATYVVLVVSLLRLDTRQMVTAPPRTGDAGGMLTAVKYVRGRPDLMLMFAIALAMGTFGFNWGITTPLMATAEFGLGAGEFGALGSVMGIGSLSAALLAARRPRPRIRQVVGSMGVFAVVLTASGLAPNFAIFAILMVPIGLTSVSVMVTANALVQMGVSAEVRGRVMALWGAVIMGLTPIVSPVVGFIGAEYGARASVLFGAVGMLIAFAAAAASLTFREGVEVHWTRRAPFVTVEPRHYSQARREEAALAHSVS